LYIEIKSKNRGILREEGNSIGKLNLAFNKTNETNQSNIKSSVNKLNRNEISSLNLKSNNQKLQQNT